MMSRAETGRYGHFVAGGTSVHVALQHAPD